METRDCEFVVADVNGRFDQLLRRPDYTALADCKDLRELVAKLNHYFPYISDDTQHTVASLRSSLYNSIMGELGEFEDRPSIFLSYFADLNRIHAFFATLETGSEEAVLCAAREFRGLSTCKSPEEAFRLYVQDTRLERYFEGAVLKADGRQDLRLAMARVLKNYYDHHGAAALDSYFREVVEAESTRQVLEICLGGAAPEDRAAYFPACCSVSEADKLRLGSARSPAEVQEIVCPPGKEPLAHAVEECMKVYANAFRQHGDLSCLYAYFRLKEQEMNNILWICECVLQGNRAEINDIILFE
ncbi:V-type H+-transporting ATPase subunit d [Pancytospora philotis]|nr:V-type H+-transporting ATPase subunit d [Pancytospora philotis]